MGKRDYDLVNGDVTISFKGYEFRVVVDTFLYVKGSQSFNAPSDLDYYGYTECDWRLHPNENDEEIISFVDNNYDLVEEEVIIQCKAICQSYEDDFV